jgi:cytosine/adenosine deaminase-related metal-dependent hydrolase
VPALVDQAKRQLEEAYETLRAARDAGVVLAMGHDSGPPGDNAIELVRMADGGLGAAEAIHAATRGSARALGLEDQIGSLEVGKRADLFVADLASSPFAAPVHHPVSALVYSAAGTEVETVVVDGRVVLDHGHLTTLDEDEVRAAAQAAADRLTRRAGTDALRQRAWRSVACAPLAVGEGANQPWV